MLRSLLRFLRDRRRLRGIPRVNDRVMWMLAGQGDLLLKRERKHERMIENLKRQQKREGK